MRMICQTCSNVGYCALSRMNRQQLHLGPIDMLYFFPKSICVGSAWLGLISMGILQAADAVASAQACRGAPTREPVQGGRFTACSART